MTDWFRSWHGAPTDPKWLGIGKKAGVAPGIAAAMAWALMDRASQAEDRGSIDGYDADGLGCFFGCEAGQVDAIVSAMTDKGMIVDGRFAAWEKRQPKREDDSSERVRQHRERHKQHAQRDVTRRDAPEAEAETDTEPQQQAQRPTASRGRAELDALDSALREAGGLSASSAPGLISLAPIIGLLDAGHDLQLDVLPTVRMLAARAKRPPSTWDYFTEAIREASARRRGVARSGLAPPVASAAKPMTTAEVLMARGRARRDGEPRGNDRADVGGVPRIGHAG